MAGQADRIAVLGAGAFGTALAIALAAAGNRVALWGHDPAALAAIAAAGENARHLPGCPLPQGLGCEPDLARAAAAPILLVAVPTQALRGLVTALPVAASRAMLVLCCKGIERGTGLLPAQVVEGARPGARVAVLTGPSFAADLARGKPTAVTLATTDPSGPELQHRLATPALRPYLGDDPLGAQLGGALKNVIAIAAGITDGAGLGDSARAALITRGFAEMVRHAETLGARRDTLFGLSGFGDLVLTCTSAQSRNYRHGLAIGRGEPVPKGQTVEGVATAAALVEGVTTAAALVETLAQRDPETEPETDLPIARTVAAVLAGSIDVAQAVARLLARPLRREG